MSTPEPPASGTSDSTEGAGSHGPRAATAVPAAGAAGATVDRILDTQTRCQNCLYLLQGQQIQREPVYGLLSIKCPECGALTSLQDYPVAAPWVRRLGMVFAGAVLAGLIVCFVGNSVAAFACQMITVEIVTEPLLNVLTLADGDQSPYRSSLQGLSEVTSSVTFSLSSMSPYRSSLQGLSEAIANAWAHPAAVRQAWANWCLIIPVTFGLAAASGGFWRLALLFQPLRYSVGIAFGASLLGTLVAAFACWLHNQWSNNMVLVGAGNLRLDSSNFSTPFLWATFAVLGTGALLGAALASPLSRVVATVLLPPRKRVALDFLWTSSGLAVPTK